MAKGLKKIEFKIVDKYNDDLKINNKSELSEGYFINVGNFVSFTQFYGKNSEIISNDYNGRIGITDNKIIK